MKYYGKKSISSFLKIVLDILLIIGVILFIIVSKSTLSSLREDNHILLFILFIIGTLSLFSIVFHARKMMKTLITKDPFVNENVFSLRIIAISSFIISACYFVNFIIEPKQFKFIYIDSKGIHTDLEFFIFFFAGLFILVLENIFKIAVSYKEENDLTI